MWRLSKPYVKDIFELRLKNPMLYCYIIGHNKVCLKHIHRNIRSKVNCCQLNHSWKKAYFLGRGNSSPRPRLNWPHGTKLRLFHKSSSYYLSCTFPVRKLWNFMEITLEGQQSFQRTELLNWQFEVGVNQSFFFFFQISSRKVASFNI